MLLARPAQEFVSPFGESAIEELKESWISEGRRFQNLYMPMNLTCAGHEAVRIVKAGSSGNTQVDTGLLQADREHQAFVAMIETVPQLFPFRRLNRLGKDLADGPASGRGQQLSFWTEGRQKLLERFGIEKCSHGSRCVIEEAEALYTL